MFGSFSSASISASIDGQRSRARGRRPRSSTLRTQSGTFDPAGASRTLPCTTFAVSVVIDEPSNGRSPYSASYSEMQKLN